MTNGTTERDGDRKSEHIEERYKPIYDYDNLAHLTSILLGKRLSLSNGSLLL